MIPLFKIPQKSTKEIIEEIHDTFYTEVDRLLASANIKSSTYTEKQNLIDKSSRLQSLGFGATKEVTEAKIEESRLFNIQVENKQKDELIEAINYFSFKYPLYKFITEDSVKKICEKYNLVYGTVDKYIGTVPEENLQHIENFKIDENDECWVSEERWVKMWRGVPAIDYISKNEVKTSSEDKYNPMSMGFLLNQYKAKLEIAAPLKDFNMTAHEVKDFKISKIEIPDPVVLQPVIFKGKKHYLIVTAWGDEASDELIVNQNFN